MGKMDYSSPLPTKGMENRFGKVFETLGRHQSATLVALPYTGRTSNLRYLANEKSFVLFDIDKTTGTYESFVYELISSIGSKSPQSYQDAYLLNKELFELISRITMEKEIVLILTLNNKALPFLKEIDRLIALSQKSATKFPLTILWSVDTEVYRKYVKDHPSSTFGQNIFYFPTFTKDETEYSIKRILLSKSISKDVDKLAFEKTGGIAGLFHFLANDLWDEDLSQEILKKLKVEIDNNKNIIDKLISKSAIDLIEKNVKNTTKFKSIKLLSNPTAQEINILNCLLENNTPVSRDDIAKILWGKSWNTKYSDWAIDKAISRLRKKIVDSEIKILTVKNFGYQLFK